MANIKDISHKERAHARLAPSKSERWLNCPASINLEENYPEQKESPWALAGTAAHERIEKALRAFFKNGKRPHWKSEDKEEEAMAMMFNYVMDEHIRLEGSKVLIEEKVEAFFIHKDIDGSLDAAIVQPFGELVIVDYKHGVSPVAVEKNTQLLIYALGIAEKYDWEFDTVKIVIVQPRVHGDLPIKEWQISIKELESWVNIFRKGAARTEATGSKPFAGDWCKYCRASIDCPALAAKSLAVAQVEFTDINKKPKLPKISEMTPEQLAKVLDVTKVLDIWLNDVKTYATEKLKDGGKIPGYELIPRRGHRQWKDVKQAAAVFGPLVREPFFSELKSPAQMEREKSDRKKPAQIKELVDKHSHSISNGVTIAKVEKLLQF